MPKPNTESNFVQIIKGWFENSRWSRKESRQQALLIFLLIPLLIYSLWCGKNIHELTLQRTELKRDYTVVNNIRYGLLSVDRWQEIITEIATQQINQFDLDPEQEAALRKALNNILNSLITQVDEMFNEKQTSLGGKLKKFAFNTFVDVNKIRTRVPEFSQTIIDEIKDPKNKRRLKFIAKDKIEELAEKTKDFNADQFTYNQIVAKYEIKDQDELNFFFLRLSNELQQQTYHNMYCILGVLCIFLLVWLLIKKHKVLYRPMYFMSVMLAFVLLYQGLTTPMMEIDARIERMSFLLMGKVINFYDQVIFFQSKSIFDVVHILMNTGKYDSIFVGALLLIFSILFPITKLLSTEAYLFGNDTWKKNRWVHFFAFKSSKWSMADVTVVAIFMAYVGFNGILENQLQDMNISTSSINSIATNHTSLQPGFILFVAFVVFSFILSEILKINFSDFGESAYNKVRDRIRIRRKS